MTRPERRAHDKRIRALPKKLKQVPRVEWPPDRSRKLLNCWRSRDYLVQVFVERIELVRLSINRTTLNGTGGWNDNMTWDELQAIKSTVGYGEYDAVEIYPCDEDVVNVANMRHLWVMPKDQKLFFAWRKRDK
jgi:hypothetical protein